jgi:hypothetical protein
MFYLIILIKFKFVKLIMLKLNIDNKKFCNIIERNIRKGEFLGGLNFNFNSNTLCNGLNKNSISFNKTQIRNFVLYIPNKKLIFINHPKYGKVYPVYIGDQNYNKKNNPKKLMPFILLFSAINLFIFLTSWELFPVTTLYQFFHSNEIIYLTSVFINVFLLRKYFKYLTDYSNRVRCMYLFPSGNKILLECFDGSVNRLENLDIYNYNIKNHFSLDGKYNSWMNVITNNNNNFKANIEWGRNRENCFEGKRKILDYEIFSQIVGRNNIDTSIQKFKKEIPIGMYSNEEKRKVMGYYAKKKFSLDRLDKNRLCYHYILLRKKYVDKKKKKNIREEFNLY